MSSQQAFPVISDMHIIDKKIIHDEVHKVFSNDLPVLLNDDEISSKNIARRKHYSNITSNMSPL